MMSLTGLSKLEGVGPTERTGQMDAGKICDSLHIISQSEPSIRHFDTSHISFCFTF